MRVWLVSAAKFIAEFLILLAIFAAAGAFASNLDAPGPLPLALGLEREALVFWPLALALVTGLGMVTWRIAQRGRFRVLLSVCFLGFGLAALGTAARFNLLPPDLPVPPPLPAAGSTLSQGEGLVSVRALEGSQARRVAALDWRAPFPRLVWAPRAAFDPGKGGLSLGGATWSLVPAPPPRLGLTLPFLGEEPLPLPLDPSDSDSFVLSLALACAFVLLCAGLSVPSVAIRWPLAAFALSLLAILLAVLAEAWLGTEAAKTLLVRDSAALGLTLDPLWLVAALEAAVGILVAALGLLLSRRSAEEAGA